MPLGIQMLGDAAVVFAPSGPYMRLNPTQPNMLGGFVSQNEVPIHAFHISFQFRVSAQGGIADCEGNPGGEGFIFFVNRTGKLGRGAGELGMGGISNSLAIAFDTWCNADLHDEDGNHISLFQNGNMDSNQALAQVVPEFDLSSGSYFVWVDYAEGKLELRINTTSAYPNQPLLTQFVEIPTLVGANKGFVGLAGASGSAYQDQDILRFTYHEPLPAMRYVQANAFYRRADGSILASLLGPNQDGLREDNMDELLVRVGTIRNGEVLSQSEGNEGDSNFPYSVFIADDQAPAGAYIFYARAWASNPIATQSPRTFFPIPHSGDPALSSSSYLDLDRWLLHVPKNAGGFNSTVKAINRTSRPGNMTFFGFSADGQLLSQVTKSVPALTTTYWKTYGTGSNVLFPGFTDLISHIGIRESDSGSELWMQTQANTTKFGAWSKEVNLSQQEALGRVVEMDPSDAQYIDGVALLNLRSKNALPVTLVQLDATTHAIVAEAQIGSVPAGGKLLALLADHVVYRANTVYRFETRDPQRSVQVLGLTFSSDFKFFATKPVQSLSDNP